jgi:predicted DNA-binding transcriptional regulator YafY
VLPSRLRHRVGAVSSATVPLPTADAPSVDPVVLALVASASADGQRLRFGYVSADGVRSRRRVEPGRLITAGWRWYLVGYDNDQDDWRTFRVDRITEPVLTGQRFTARLPAGVDPAQFAMNKLYSTAPVFRAVVTVHGPDARARELLGGWELSTADDQGGRLTSPPDTVEWLAARLIRLGCEFEVHSPPELVDHLAELTARVARAVR